MSLIERTVHGDLEAFNQLVLAYQDQAYNHAHAILGDQAQAEDATQEGFIRAFQKIAQFRGGSFRAWMLRIVTNTAYDHWRRANRWQSVPLFPEDDDGEEIDSSPWLIDPALSVEALVEQNELTRHIQAKLDELPAAYRSVINLVDLYELDYKEAADILQVPIGTIKSRLARARLLMQEKLKEVASEIASPPILNKKGKIYSNNCEEPQPSQPFPA
jgi:RNA polymerase sigma-70 factor (ECF subfamily)